MSKCSEERDFAVQLEKDSFNSSTELYLSLTTKLQNLSSRIKAFLEFVSNGILYILGFNPQMYSNLSGSGDGSIFSGKAHLQRRSRKNHSYFDKHMHSAKENGSSSSGDSSNQPDSSDSETRCCFGVNRLKRFVLRRRRQAHHAKRRHEKRHVKRKTDESASTSAKSVPVEEKQNSVSVEKLQDLCRKSMTDDNIEKNLEKDEATKGSHKSLFTKTKNQPHPSRRKPVSESIMISAGYYQKRNMPDSTMNSDCVSTMTKEAQSIAEDVERVENTDRVVNAQIETDNLDIKNKTSCTGETIDSDLHISGAILSSENVNKNTDISPIRPSRNSELFNKILEEASCKPLEKAEEDVIRGVLNRPVFESISYRLPLTSIYCTVVQALRQRMKSRDKIFEESMHSCRRSIYNYIKRDTEEHSEDTYDTETLYFKAVVHFYNQFKQCALDHNYDIGRFIQKSKDEAERELHMNTDKEIATAVRRLDKESEDNIITSIRGLFQESSEIIQENEDTRPITVKESSNIETGYMTENRQDNINQIKQDMSEYLTRFAVEGVETNKSFQESIDCLSDHFAQLGMKDNQSKPVETQSVPTDAEEAKGKTCFKVKVYHFQPATNPFSIEPIKSETRFDHINPWKGGSVITSPRGNVTTTPQSTEETSAENFGQVRNTEFIRNDTPELNESERNIAHEDMIGEHQAGFPSQKLGTNSEKQGYYTFGCGEMFRDMMRREYPAVFTSNPVDTKNYDSDTEDTFILEDIYRHVEQLKKMSYGENVDGTTGEEGETEQNISEQHEAERLSGEKKQPPPVPKKPKDRKAVEASGNPRKRQPPPVPKKPDPSTRHAASQNRQLDGTDLQPWTGQSNNENNSFMSTQYDPYPYSDDDDGIACSKAKRAFQEFASYCDEQERRVTDGTRFEIHIGPNGAYEVVCDQSGKETKVANLPDFRFGHFDDESVQCDTHAQDGISVADSATKRRKRPAEEQKHRENERRKRPAEEQKHWENEPRKRSAEEQKHWENEWRKRPAEEQKHWENERTERPAEEQKHWENADEIYEEHFDIDRSVYDESGCKIMPGSCKKVNPRALQQKDRRKLKTKGVANKHLTKAFNDAAQNQEHYDGDDENECQPLLELDELDNDEFENRKDENNNKLQVKEMAKESVSESPDVNVSYIEDVRHWQMLPTEVRRKQDDENNFDDKYSIPSKGRTPEDKKKGKKKKERKQKPQPMSLLELKYQFQ